MMLSFNHPNVMSLIGMCFDGELPLLIMPFMINGTLLNCVKRNIETLYLALSVDERQVSLRFSNVGSGFLAYMIYVSEFIQLCAGSGS